MKRKITNATLVYLIAVVLGGCAIQERATYDVSRANDLKNIAVTDLREPGNPAGYDFVFDPRRRYLSENALGEPLIEIMKSRLAAHDPSFPEGRPLAIKGIEISVIPVDNSMGENANDPGATYEITPLFLPTVGVIPLVFGPSSNKSLISVRAVIRYESGVKKSKITKHGMSTKSKMTSEIKKVYFKAIDQLAGQL